MAFWDYFNGSKYYSLRNTYRQSLFEQAKAVVQKYKLNVPLYDEVYIRPLSDAEATKLKNEREGLRANIALKDGYGASAIVNFYDEGLGLEFNNVRVRKIGLKTLTDLLAEIKARSESGYALDLIDPAVVAGFVASYLLGIALSYIPYTAALGITTQQAATWGLAAAIIAIISYIVELGDKAQLEAIKSEVVSQENANTYLARSNYYMQTKKLSAGAMNIYGGLEPYANGKIYTAQSAGSESFCPTKAYNPSQGFARGFDTYNQKLAQNDEHTQGRAQYTLAGNEGYSEQINKDIPLSHIKELENDFAYKLNYLKQHNQRLLLGYGELGAYLGSDENIKANVWLQNVYNADYRGYKDVYYDYVESKSFISEMRSYNKAVRFKGEFFSRSNDERKWQTIAQSVKNPSYSYTPPSQEEISPSDPISSYKDFVRQGFYSRAMSEGWLEEYFSTHDELLEGSKEWLESEKAMLESLRVEEYIDNTEMSPQAMKRQGGNLNAHY